jgi:zinc-binding alcohol dehydrogenase/oxidoreductase
MKALLLVNDTSIGNKKGYKLSIVHDAPDPRQTDGASNIKEKNVKLEFASLNHRDNWCTKGMYPGIKTPSILGADGSGRTEPEGQRVLINASFGWDGEENPCPSKKPFHILGLQPLPGTFAQYIKVPHSHLYPVPPWMSMEEAASIPLAGLTAYR